MTTSTTRISLSEISQQLEVTRLQVRAMKLMVSDYVADLTTDVIKGVEPVVRNTYVLRNAVTIESYIDAALKDLQSANVFVQTFQRKEQEDAD